MQFLDGVGAGLQSVAVPSLVARILNGTGRINTGQGAVMTAQGIGASLSPAVGGWLAQELGYSTAFLILGSVAIGSVLLWLLFTTTIKQASAISGDEPTLDANAEHSCVAACAVSPHILTWTIIALAVCGVILRPFNLPEGTWAVT